MFQISLYVFSSPKVGILCVCFFVVTYKIEVISVGGHKKNTRPTELFTSFEALFVQNPPLRTTCAQGGPNNSNCHGRRSRPRTNTTITFVSNLYNILPDHLCVDGIDDGWRKYTR